MKLRHLLLCAAISCSLLGKAQAITENSPDSTRYVPAVLTVDPTETHTPRLLMLKTNALPWAATIMNIEAEIQVSRQITVSLPICYCPWFIAERHALRVAALQPEGRWWLAHPGEGHFGGIHATVAWYNLKWNKYRYQDRGRPMLGAGITYGYAFRFSEEWGLELSAGVGYLNTRYDRFYNTANGQLVDTRNTSYFGLDHLSVSVVYRLKI